MSIRNSLALVIAATFLIVFAVACGGNGTSDPNGDPDGPENRPPTAEAGADQNTTVGDQVTLDGSGSSDPDGDALTFSWSIDNAPAGTSASLGSSSGATTTLTPDVSGTYTLTLTVSDGHASDSDQVDVVATENQAPTADAGPDRTVTVGESLTLDGTNSNDPDGDALDYSWTFVTSPGSTPTLTDSDTPSPSFTPNEAGDYTLELTVSDGSLSDSDRVTISADPNAPSTTVYVSVSGDDSNPGTRDSPVATLQRALEVVANNDLGEISIANGRYDSEPYGYVTSRSLTIYGESQTGVVLAGGSADILTVEASGSTSDTVTVRLRDLTFETTGAGLRLPDEATEASMQRVTCTNTDPCASTGDSASLLPVPGGVLSVRDSLAQGSGTGSGFVAIGQGHLIQGTTIRDFDNGIRGLAASFDLRNVTIENNGLGIELFLQSDSGNPVRVTNGSSLTGNGVGIRAEDAHVELDTVTISGSGEHGVLFDASAGPPFGIFRDVSVEQNGFSGVRLNGGELEVFGGNFQANGQGSPDDPIDRAGIFAGLNSSLDIRESQAGITTLSDNVQDNLTVIDSATATLEKLDARDVTGPGAGIFLNTSGSVTVVDVTLTGHNNGMYVTGSGDLTLDGIFAGANRSNGLSYRGSGSLVVRNSEFQLNVDANVKITQPSGEASQLDFGTSGDPGNNTLERYPDTGSWSLSDERPDRANADGTILTAHGVFFEASECTTDPSGLKTGYAESSPCWRVTGENQRVDFGN